MEAKTSITTASRNNFATFCGKTFQQQSVANKKYCAKVFKETLKVVLAPVPKQNEQHRSSEPQVQTWCVPYSELHAETLCVDSLYDDHVDLMSSNKRDEPQGFKRKESRAFETFARRQQKDN